MATSITPRNGRLYILLYLPDIGQRKKTPSTHQNRPIRAPIEAVYRPPLWRSIKTLIDFINESETRFIRSGPIRNSHRPLFAASPKASTCPVLVVRAKNLPFEPAFWVMGTACHHWLHGLKPTDQELHSIRRATIFQGLTDAQLQIILQAARLVQVERHGFFFHQGEPASTFYVILQGNVRLAQLTPEGRQVIMHYFGPGSEIAVIVVLGKADYPVSAEGASDAA
ncbi:MAG: cyclic nucleotide-binding domain-containing protein, partial [bacterium]|nr:cyclic nucleotide-binding domain-containing protein [bacterium]